MNTIKHMDFRNNKEKVLLYPDEQKMFLNGDMFKITITKEMNNMKYCRFTFGDNNEAKIYNQLLTLSIDGNISTYLLFDDKIETTSVEKYLIRPGNYLYLDKNQQDYLLIDDEKVNVLKKYIQGVYTVYDTDKGTLFLSKDKTRNSRWNNCSIFLSS